MIIIRQSCHEESLFLFGGVSRAALPGIFGDFKVSKGESEARAMV
jgi:hypothetical protein